MLLLLSLLLLLLLFHCEMCREMNATRLFERMTSKADTEDRDNGKWVGGGLHMMIPLIADFGKYVAFAN